MHPRSFASILIFKIEDGTEASVASFFEDHTVTVSLPNDEGIENEYDLMYVPTEMILDGITTCDRPIITRALPESVDRGKFQVT